ncbi:hypothetical protein MB46_19465 (plasmid) [Arthrobacter alpinus]|uniref:hypothetical protein n=1 Tax=Arthrobacter alpinus TaxID=656366 RepID=UPI0005C975C9|nr:hypothetical protein [Arthrobacter alpinus]ALV47854.1 hypothetical protein MB46_19465 [Arthrobacter alpinus]
MEKLRHQDTYLSLAQAEIREQLSSRGYASIDEDELTVSTNQWRKIARDVADELDRPIKSTLAKGCIYAVLIDWPRANEVCAYPPCTKLATNGIDFLNQLTRPERKTGLSL